VFQNSTCFFQINIDRIIVLGVKMKKIMNFLPLENNISRH